MHDGHGGSGERPPVEQQLQLAALGGGDEREVGRERAAVCRDRPWRPGEPVHLVGPEHLVGVEVPLPAAEVGEPLGVDELGLPLGQSESCACRRSVTSVRLTTSPAAAPISCSGRARTSRHDRGPSAATELSARPRRSRPTGAQLRARAQHSRAADVEVVQRRVRPAPPPRRRASRRWPSLVHVAQPAGSSSMQMPSAEASSTSCSRSASWVWRCSAACRLVRSSANTTDRPRASGPCWPLTR